MQVIRMMMVYLEGERVRRAMPSGVFRTSDGWLQLLIVREHQWRALCGVLGTPELANDPRFADGESRIDHEAELLTIVRPAMAEKSTSYWAHRLREADIMHERLNSFRDFVAQPQAFLELPDVPDAFPVPNIAGVAPFAKGTPRAMTPVPGQHTRTILQEHGYSADEIAGLITRKVISAP